MSAAYLLGMNDFKRLLVPVDFADCSKKALETALALAAKLSADVEVFHAWIPPPSASMALAPGVSVKRIEEMQSDLQKEAEQDLRHFLESVTIPSQVRVTTRAAMGAPHELILAHSSSFDLVVLGTHGRRGIAHFFLGSVAAAAIRSCKTPVMVVNAAV